MKKVRNVGEGKVVLIAGGGKIYSDIAAKFVRSTRDMEDIIASDYNKDLVRKIVGAGHFAVTEFDTFIFGVEGYSRVTEVQLVRKRLASYMISSGRNQRKSARDLDVVLPEDIMNINIDYKGLKLSTNDILDILDIWYNKGFEEGHKDEELRYMKPQATNFKALISMNARALNDWFKIRCCMNAQTEIRDMANKMLALCKEVAPDLFINAGPACKSCLYCPENSMQNSACKGKIPTKEMVKEIIKNAK